MAGATAASAYTPIVPGRLLIALVAIAIAAGAAAEPAPEVRIFEVRRINSDFEPIENLSFRLANDGSRVQPSQWLATLARRVPDGFLAQLLSLRSEPLTGQDGPVWEAVHSRGRRAVRVRVEDLPGDEDTPSATRVELALLRDGEPAWTASAEEALEPGGTVVLSGRYFEVTPSRYLSWFREAPDLPARERLYERLRDHSIWLVAAVSRPAEARGGEAPVRVAAPSDPRLLAFESSVVPEADGTVELRLRLDGRGRPRHIEIASTTLPEVTPRLLAIAAEWRFPGAADGEAVLGFPVASRPARRPR